MTGWQRPRPGRRAVLLSLLAGACSSSEPAYYTLAPMAPAKPVATPPKAPRTIELRRFGLAGYLDRPEIIRTGGDYQLRVAGGERWGEPLGDLIGRVTAENLATRLYGLSVFTQAGGITSDPEATVEVHIQRFDAEIEGPVTLLAQIAVRRGQSTPLSQSIRLQAEPAGKATRDIVAAMSRVLGEMSDAVAELVRRT